jgi:5-methylcytosine-specific restriction enzyme subunit McrC
MTYLTEHGIPIRNLWHMLLYAWNDYAITNQIAFSDVEESPTLDALLASMLSKLIRQRLRVGLGRDYTNVKSQVKGIRGKINFPESLRRNSFEQGQAFCEFHQYQINVPKNQIIRSTLHQLIQNKNLLSNELRALSKSLDGIDLIQLNYDFIHRTQLYENDRDYKLMLAICELIVQINFPADSSGDDTLPTLNRDEMTLHLIYEKFVANFYRLNLRGWLVTAQKHLVWHETLPNPLLPAMKPDLILEEKSSGRMLVIDTKFTTKSLVQNQWGKVEFDSSHLYQLYAYLKTQEHISEKHKNAVGVLLYPSMSGKVLSEAIQLQGSSMRVESVDLGAEWQEIEKRLIEVIHAKN